MRVTNNMILKNSASNINGTKVAVDKTNKQMTTQQKISRPSEDPVTAIRSLRLSTQLSQINQYYEKNIPDAESWLEVTETAISNMKSIITNYRTLCDKGANGTLTQDDRNTILTQLKSLQEQLYEEGNSDYAGRTVFTGYRTDKSLTFTENELDTKYNITEKFTTADIEKYRYYNGEVTIPTTLEQTNSTTYQDANMGDMTETEYNRLRMAYNGADGDSLEYIKIGDNQYDLTTAGTASSGSRTATLATNGGGTLTVYNNEAE
jgi:flagellar hook-associated protein 3 FlgL